MRSIQIGNVTIKRPILQGGMGVGVSLSKLALSVMNEGGLGVLSAAHIGYRDPNFENNSFDANQKALMEEIKKVKKENGAALGVNIMTAMNHYEETVLNSVKAGCDVIISGAGLPIKLPELLSNTPVKFAPIVSSLKAIQVLFRTWLKRYQRVSDFVIIEGPCAGGHLGFTKEELHQEGFEKKFQQDLPLMLTYIKNISSTMNQSIPVILAGGIGTKKDVERAFQLGFDGIQVGTKFVATHECDVHKNFKDAYVRAEKKDIAIIDSPVGMPARALKTELVKTSLREKIPISHCYHCIKTCDKNKISYCISQALIQAAKGNIAGGLVFCGETVTQIERIQSVKEVIHSLFGS